MFLIESPQGPFASFLPVIESEIYDQSVEGFLFKQTSSWIFGDNIKGRKNKSKFYFGGFKRYSDWVRREIEAGFLGFDNNSNKL